MNKGAQLNQRVWKLFAAAGFYTEPNQNDPNEYAVTLPAGKHRSIDLFASDANLNVKILGSNKSGKINSWTEHVNDFVELCKKGQFDKLLFVVTGKRLEEADIEYARQKKASVWTLKELQYYEELVDTIKQYAKYEILHNLGISTREEDEVKHVLALRIRQPKLSDACELYTFTLELLSKVVD